MNVQNILEKVHHYVSLEWRICEPMFIWTFHLKITQKIVYQIYCGYSVNTLYTTFNSILMRTNFKYSIKSITNLTEQVTKYLFLTTNFSQLVSIWRLWSIWTTGLVGASAVEGRRRWGVCSHPLPCPNR